MNIPNCIIITNQTIGMMVRIFAKGPGNRGSIPGRIIVRTQNMVLDASLLSTQHYKVRIKGKLRNPRKREAPSSTTRCCRYVKRKPLGRPELQSANIYIYIYIYTHMYIINILLVFELFVS